jgi:hypothetical protein
MLNRNSTENSYSYEGIILLLGENGFWNVILSEVNF